MDLDDVNDLAFQLMDDHGLIADGWTFKFDRAERRVGACHYRTKTITISAPLAEINDEDVIEYTILHEIAHAHAGFKAAHGFEFVMAARALGIDGSACITDANSNEPHWWGRCPNCGMVRRKLWRLSTKAQNQACGACCNEFNNGDYSSAFQLSWEDHR